MRGELATAEQLVAAIAARQHGVVTFAQLLGAGLSKGAIDRRVRSGRLHRVYRGVYAVGHPGLSSEGWWMGAVLACGEGAVLSHRPAAMLWKLLPVSDCDPHVTVAGTNGRSSRDGLILHRSSSLRKGDTTRRVGIPVTTPARTLCRSSTRGGS
jgi:hypothetical protein